MYYRRMNACVVGCMRGSLHAWLHACVHACMRRRGRGIEVKIAIDPPSRRNFFVIYCIFYAGMCDGMHPVAAI